MDPVSTVSLRNIATFGIQTAEQTLNTDIQQADTGQKANDLQGYGQSAAQITATQAVQSRISAYLTAGTNLSGQLTVQDQTLQQVASAGGDASNFISQALAAGDGTSLMTQLQGVLSDAVSALNTQYNGQYLYAGGNSNTAPVTAKNLADLTAAPSISSLFTNGSVQTVSRLDDNTQVTTGQLASTVGTPLFTALQSVEAYNQGPNGPFTGTLTPAQTTFLQGVVATFNAAQSGVTNIAAQNGAVQAQLTTVTANLTDQQTTLKTSLSNLTDVDEAQAATNLQQAQSAFQAAAQVYSTLKSASLLNYLSASSTGG